MALGLAQLREPVLLPRRAQPQSPRARWRAPAHQQRAQV